MLFNKKIEQYDFGQVQAVNGIVRFQNIILNVYSFAVDGVLVDTGAKTLLKQFKPFFDKADLDQVVISHFHEDHTGGASYIQQQKNIPIYMNELSIEQCANKADYPLYRKLFWGARPAFTAEPIQQNFHSRHAKWEVINTPGHAKDHLAFLNMQTGQLFTGDLYVTPKTKLVLREEHVPSIIDSLQRVLRYDFDEVFCCHAGYVQKGRRAISSKLAYLQEIEGKVFQLHGQGYSLQEIQHTLFSKQYPLTKVSFGEWDSKHIITSILEEHSV